MRRSMSREPDLPGVEVDSGTALEKQVDGLALDAAGQQEVRAQGDRPAAGVEVGAREFDEAHLADRRSLLVDGAQAHIAKA